MKKPLHSLRAGTTLIDLVLSMAIIALLFGGVYLVYFSIETALANVGVRTAATEAVDNEIEMVRNLPYGSVGTVGGIPTGVIPQSQSVTQGNFNFVLQTTVLNIDDPYDESPSSTPVADYKLLDITASCPLCQNFVPIEITTTVAPSLLEQGTNYGSIFIYTINADGLAVADATIQVVNASVTPSIDLTDTTNASGVLKLIGVPTSTQGYQIFATKPGYSSAGTYPAGAPSNPNPIQPNITVASQTVSNVTFAIDQVSTLNVSTTDDRCNAVGNEPFSLTGAKLIGTSPNVLAFATSSETSAGGSATFNNLEWDIYTIALDDASQDVAGTIPFSPLTIDPSSTQAFQFILLPAADPSLLVSVEDASTGAGIANANVSIADGGVDEALVTDHATFSQNNWTGGQYASQDGGIDDTNPGSISLLANASGTYSTSTTDWLISNTFDVGGTASTFNTLSWTPVAEPPNTTLEFQVAANNDNATWNFVGPDGTAGTFFTATTSTLPASLAGNRYFRYEVFMSTQDPNATPTLHGASVDFTANCVPPAQALFTSLTPGTHSVDVTAPNYLEATGTAAVGSGESSTTILMTQS